MDEKDQQAYKELQNKMIETSQKQKLIEQQLRITGINMKKASLTQEELKPMSEDTRLYEGIGRAYFLKPRNKLLEQLEKAQTTGESEIQQLNEQAKVVAKARKEVEEELRELLQHSPALVRSLQGA